MFFGQLLVFEFYINEIKFILIDLPFDIPKAGVWRTKVQNIAKITFSGKKDETRWVKVFVVTKIFEQRFQKWLRKAVLHCWRLKKYWLHLSKKNVFIPVGTGNYRNKHCWTGVLVYYWMSLMLKKSFFLRRQVVEANVWYMAHMIKRYVNFAQIS